MRREESAKPIDASDPRIGFDKKKSGRKAGQGQLEAGQGQLGKFQFATT